jgi:hypothetical protein
MLSSTTTSAKTLEYKNQVTGYFPTGAFIFVGKNPAQKNLLEEKIFAEKKTSRTADTKHYIVHIDDGVNSLLCTLKDMLQHLPIFLNVLKINSLSKRRGKCRVRGRGCCLMSTVIVYERVFHVCKLFPFQESS